MIDDRTADAPMMELARWASAALRARKTPDHVAMRSLSWARQMVVMTLLLEIRHGASRDAALHIAGRELVVLHGLTPGSVKKNRSEARAVLEFGGIDEPQSATNCGPVEILDDLVARISAIRLDEVRRRRATALRGAHGGRPTTGQMRILALVRRLRVAATVNPSSAREYEAIRAELKI